MKSSFTCGVNRLGDKTCKGEYVVSAEQEGTIDVTLDRIPRKTHVKAIHCDGSGDIGHSRGWNSDEGGQTATLAVGVEQGTCFRLVFSGDGPWEYDVSGSAEY